VPETVARQISGHRTRSIFDRYDIVSEQDIADALTVTYDHLTRTTGTRTVVATQARPGRLAAALYYSTTTNTKGAARDRAPSV
jgi:hypothetical protein